MASRCCDFGESAPKRLDADDEDETTLAPYTHKAGVVMKAAQRVQRGSGTVPPLQNSQAPASKTPGCARP